MSLLSRFLPSVRVITAGITRATAALEVVALREQKKAEAALVAASALVTQANAHRSEAHAARRIAKALSDLTGPAQDPAQ